MKIKTKTDRRERIKFRLRKRTRGTSERPRMTVFRSLAHISVQVIDDRNGRTLVSASSLEPAVKSAFKLEHVEGTGAGRRLLVRQSPNVCWGRALSRFVFDRGGFLYHGRVRAVAEAAREAGLEF